MVNLLNWTSVTSHEVVKSKYRLEASVFNVDAKAAKKAIEVCKHPVVNLWSDEGLVKSAFYPGRFKRIYVEKGYGYPMVLPSQMLSIKPIATKFISKKTYDQIGTLDLKKGQLLITRSGTIGNCTIVTETLEGTVMSDDVIRVTFNDEFDLGFVYTFLKTKTGQLVLATNNYGSVVQHIEPEHLCEVVIPKPIRIIRESIHNKIMDSFELRDKSNKLIEEAELLLVEALQLPPIDQIKVKYFQSNAGVKNYSITLDLLNNRFDGSYHDPIVVSILDYLFDNSEKVLSIENEEISKEIILPGRFKRNYVDEVNGTVFLGGKQIYELDPTNKKFLSVKMHGDRIAKQLFLYENMIAITCSGTIGKVNIIPKHWEKWTMSQHVLRIVAKNNDIAGYLYIWLNSEYGDKLIEKHIYGSVVDEIDQTHLAKVPVPILRDKSLMKRINDLALEANKLRSEAYYLEQDAIKQMNEEVIFA